MSQPGRFTIRWTPCNSPLLPVAVAGRGEISLDLARRLLRFDDESLSRLEGVAGKQLIVVQGAPDRLPWVDGVQYLGIASDVPSVLLPTNYQPSLPQEILAKTFATQFSEAGLIAVLPDPLLLVPMKSAGPVSRQQLASWLEQQ